MLLRQRSTTMKMIGTTTILIVVVGIITLQQAIVPTDASFWDSNSGADEKIDETETYKKAVVNSHNGAVPPGTTGDYGADVSFPIHHYKVSTNYPWLPHNVDPVNNPTPPEYKDMVIQPLGDRQGFYDEFVNSCMKYNGGERCKGTERDRVDNIMAQPPSMQNYTKIGFKKIKAPPELYKLIKTFWDNNKYKGIEEQWGIGNTYTNNWESKSYMVSVENTNLRGAGDDLKQKIWDSARDIIGEWTGQDLTQCSLYGIRVYTEGAILSPHIDRLPLVSSAILHVDSDVDEPWPLEVYGHDGKAYNVTSEPGDMILYESHSVIHGRPFRLKGRYVANIFIHFEPTGHSVRHNAKMEAFDLDQDVNAKYRAAVLKGHGGHENAMVVPPYIVEGSTEGENWKRTHPEGYKSQRNSFTTGSTIAHELARTGGVDKLKEQVQYKKSLVNAKDENGFTPLHEGVLGGHLDVVRFLVESGADYNAKTHGEGGTALWWAKQELDEDHPVIEFLESLGALDIGPEL